MVKIDDELKHLREIVCIERKNDKQCPSANDDVNFKLLLQDIIEKKAYKSDYDNITSALLFEKLNYDTTVMALEKILKSDLFD